MSNSIMLFNSQIHEIIIAAPSIRMKKTLDANLSSNYRLKCYAFTVRNYLGIDLTIPLEDPKNNRFTEVYTKNWSVIIGAYG